MGTRTRILGADAVLRGVTETTYGTIPTTGYKLLSFKSCALDSEKPLGYDPLLGQGRDAADPYYNVISVTGDIVIPLDVRNLGFWLHGLLGTDTQTSVGAFGDFYFTAQPANNSTLTLNGVTWTFVTGAAGSFQTQISAVNLAATLTALASNLNASVDTEIAKVTYSATATSLLMSFDTTGITGNTYTLAASANSNARPSNSTLWGGGTQHQFTSGGDIPSKTLEVGNPQLTVGQFYRLFGSTMNTLAFDMTRSGPANGTMSVISQGRSDSTTTIDGSAAIYTGGLIRFSQGRGAVRLGGNQIANITGAKLTLSNNLAAVETIRADGLIDGVDAGEFRATGTITVRAGIDTTLSSAVTAETPVALEFSFSTPAPTGYLFRITLPRVFLPKPKSTITGPAGVEQTFDIQASKDATATYLARVILCNDLSAQYT